MATPSTAGLAARAELLVERVGKLHVQGALGLVGARTARSLAAASQELESALRDLRGVTTGEARDAWLLVGLVLEEARPLLARAPTRDGAKAFAERADEMAWVAAKGRRAAGVLPGGAGRAAEAALLSQRLGRLYLLRVAAGGAAQGLATLRTTGAALHAAVASLARDPGLAAEVELARNQEAFLGPAIERLAAGKAEAGDAEAVAKTCDNVMEAVGRAAR